MYEVEEITDNFNDNSRWFSVIHNMEMFRVEVSGSGWFYYNQDQNFLKDDDEEKINIKRAVKEYIGE